MNLVQAIQGAKERVPLTPGKLLGYITGGFAVLFLVIALWPFATVPAGHRGVVTSFGKVESIRDEGLQLIFPWQNVNLISIRADSADVSKAEGGTLDLQPVHVNLTVRYQILPNKVQDIFLNFSKTGDMDNYVQTATADAFKAVTAKYRAEELILKRQEVTLAVKDAIDKRVDQYGVNIVGVDVTNFAFAPAFMKAIEQKVTEEQQKKAEENKLQRMMVEQQQNVEKAKADAQAQKASADGEAYAVKTVATARADALRIENSALRESKDVLELRKIEVERAKAEKWDGKLPVNMYSSGPLPFLNLNQAK